MKKLFPLILAVILAFVLVLPVAADAWPVFGQAFTRIPIATRSMSSALSPVVCRLPAGTHVVLVDKVDELDEYGKLIARWWYVEPDIYYYATAGACDGWLKSGALRDVVFSPLK